MTNIMPPSPLAYEGQVVVPYIIKQQAPTTSNIQFPVPTLWIWTAQKKVWILVSVALGIATWVQLSGGSAGPLLEIAVPHGTSPVAPDNTGLLTLTSSANTIQITGSTNSINFDLTGGGAAIEVVHTDSGDVAPSAGAITLTGANGITTSGSGSTGTITLAIPVTVAHGGTGDTSLTIHNVLIGEGTSAIGFAAPSATTGVPLISNGAAADPSFGTASIAGGGTNATSMSTSSGLVKYDGTRLVTSSTATVDSSNFYTNTAQPAFLYFLDGDDANVTGDGTVWRLGSGTALTQVYDQASNCSTAGIFTAPKTGIYKLEGTIFVFTGTSITAAFVTITTTKRSYSMGQSTPGVTGQFVGNVNALANMTAGDTAFLTVSTVDTGGKIDDVRGATGGATGTFFSWFSGYLAT